MEKNKTPSRRSDRLYMLTGLLIVISLVAAVGFLKNRQDTERARKPTPLSAVSYYPIPKTRGPDNAPVKLVEYSDFECPACQAEYPVVKEILKNYGDKILFVFRDFPLIASHPNSLLAAVAGHCAWEQGKFWEMHDKIFEIKDLSAAALQTYGRQIGLNPSQFSACLRSDKYLKEIETDLNEGYSAGVRATPTFFVNGVKVAGALDLMTFEKIIIEALSR